MKFVWLDVPGGGRLQVNPDQVLYLQQNPATQRTELVFGAGAHGLHVLTVEGDRETVARQLEGSEPTPPDSGPRWSRNRLPPENSPPQPEAKRPPKRTALKRGKARV